MTSSFASPQLNATFNKHTSSHAGKFRLVSTPTGVLSQVVPQVSAVTAAQFVWHDVGLASCRVLQAGTPVCQLACLMREWMLELPCTS